MIQRGELPKLSSNITIGQNRLASLMLIMVFRLLLFNQALIYPLTLHFNSKLSSPIITTQQQTDKT
jgi:hypothetical protein